MARYVRADGFEVSDAKSRGAVWASETYGGAFVEVEDVIDTTGEEVAKNKAFLASTDYKILKKLEKLLPQDDVDVIERQSKRDRINELESK